MEKTEEKRSPHLWRRVILGVMLLVLVLLAVVIAQAPEMIRQQLRNYGVEQASVGEMHFNLLMGSATVTGVEFTTEGRPPLRVGELSLQWDWFPLFSSRLAITHLRLDGAEIDLREGEAGWMVSPLVMPEAAKGEAVREEPAAPSA